VVETEWNLYIEWSIFGSWAAAGIRRREIVKLTFHSRFEESRGINKFNPA
jgi:hypothetical protein